MASGKELGEQSAGVRLPYVLACARVANLSHAVADYYWDNDEAANVVCRNLGFASGVMYTFGATRLLPTLPIVAGFQTCQGGETNILQCTPGGAPQDPDCWIGCRGADGIMGTADDSIDPTCTHNIVSSRSFLDLPLAASR